MVLSGSQARYVGREKCVASAPITLGVPMVSTDLESNNMILLNPNSTKEYYFEGFIPADRYEMVKGKTAVIKINYKDLTGKKQVRTWQTEFDFKLDE